MRTWVLAAGAAAASAVFLGVLSTPGVSDLAVNLVSNLGQLLAAVLAAGGCTVAARRTSGHRRAAWTWLAVGTGAWGAGQAVWSFYEVVLSQDVPFPSLADVGFLTFPLAAGFGLVLWLGTQSHQIVARGRDLLDGAVIAGSLLVLSWVTVMAPIVAAGADSWFPLTLSLAYPVGDVVLGTLVLLALARGGGDERATLWLLAVGLGGFALADSTFVFLTSQGVYSSADLVSSGGWVLGFLFVGVSGLSVRPAVRAARAVGDAAPVRPTRLRLLLPYLPLAAAGTALCVDLNNGPTTPATDLTLGVVLVVMVMSRQFLAMSENQRLLSALALAHEQLEHQALHDALTGLANRVLFADRLDRALLQPSANVSVLFCDLDDFKLVNDGLGHEAGDELLKLVAKRLLACVRGTDTVARLGGDEFAILLDDSSDAEQVAERVVTSMNEHVTIGPATVRTSISVGIAHHEGVHAPLDDRRELVAVEGPGRLADAETLASVAQREATAALLLRLADSAMYAAKGAGKSRAVLAPEHARGHSSLPS